MMSLAKCGILATCVSCLIAAPVFSARAASATSGISYRQQIRPILAANCFKCHGPDATTREADLRLDVSVSATVDRGGYAAIAPGDLEASEVWRRIMSEDPDMVMPPPSSNKNLTAEQKALLARWIREGAPYETHWAFQRPVKPALPKVSDSAWIKNDIDFFILSALETNGLKPSPPADRYQLVRRLHLDLIGLPPTPAEADQFVNDERPDAYERLVDRLLASPHYGERWARRWLDLARYSDTNGYEKDRPRSMWLYRDWVIQALNRDMPFDQFTIEQLAGDMLPNPTEGQLIATGFHRNTMTNEEGGVDPEEFRFNSIVDRVATTGTAWLGLTLGCAQCHTHKFDPLTHQEYYGIFALFNNADEVVVHVDTPDVVGRRAETEKQIAALKARLRERFAEANAGDAEQTREAQIAASGQTMQQAFGLWKDKVASELAIWQTAAPISVRTNLATVSVLDDQSVLLSGDVTKIDIYDLEFDLGETTVSEFRIEALADDRLPGGGPGRQSIDVVGASSEGDFFLSEIAVTIVGGTVGGERTERPVAVRCGRASFATAGMSAESAIDGRGDTGWRIMGREGESHAAVYEFKEPVTLAKGERLKFQLVHESFYPAGLGRFRFAFSDAQGELPFALYPADLALAISSPQENQASRDNDLLLDYYLLLASEFKVEQEKIAELEKKVAKPIPALALSERIANPRTTRRHVRGEFLNVAEEVGPGVPECLPPLPPGAPANRLTFARWLVDADNPLTARVVANRQWQSLFGRGLVQTVADFGVQGEYPSHPELLDYLATTLVERGWSVKQLHKLIVMSATYQQAAAISPLLLERDPENKLLARAPRFRLEAELVRDAVLKAGELLSPRIGGPSVFPDQPPGVTESAYGPLEWKVNAGEDRFRRGLYTFNKRTAPYASFGLFDAPSGEVCCPRRTNSNTPLQSLALLNDTVVMEASRALARRAIAGSNGEAAHIATEMFRRCVTRPPTSQEMDAICAFYEKQKGRAVRNEIDIKAIAGNCSDPSECPGGVDKASVAAWIVTARAILNLDETITRQ